MNNEQLNQRLREIRSQKFPLIKTNREILLQRIFEVARENLSLAKLVEAHWDAINLLREGNRPIEDGQLYAIWASEIPGKALKLTKIGKNWILNGTKMFCSGAGMVDRAILTVSTPESLLIDINLREYASPKLQIDLKPWATRAFQGTNTATVTFNHICIDKSNIIGNPGWYITRRGFWLGALGPAACWGGGAAGLVDYARQQQRKDPHTLAHLGALEANIWAIQALLQTAAKQSKHHCENAQLLALKTRHIIEQLCTDILKRFARAYGPYPLACHKEVSSRYLELDLFLRQNHGERDLESLGNLVKKVI